MSSGFGLQYQMTDKIVTTGKKENTEQEKKNENLENYRYCDRLGNRVRDRSISDYPQEGDRGLDQRRRTSGAAGVASRLPWRKEASEML